MTHDPLCPNSKGSCCPWMGECACQCRCDLILKVRADERGEAMTHDIKCPIVAPSLAFDNERVCQCRLIKVVRDHEKSKWTHRCPDNNCCHQPGD